MKPITISINPHFLCNMRCPWCYLTPEQLADKKKISLKVLEDRLKEVVAHTEIEYIDLYGGEVTLLKPDYIEEMLAIINKYYSGPISVITNLSRPLEKTEWLLDDNIILSASWDYTCREGWDVVTKNIALLPKDVHILMLASHCMINWTDSEIGASQMILNSLQNVQSVEIKPYSTNQANQEQVTFKDFEEFVKRWLDTEKILPEKRHYEFINEKQIKASLNKSRNAWSDDHVYITPTGCFGVLEFDDNDNEYFMELDSFQEYVNWTLTEKQRVTSNPICIKCPHLGHCLSEHIRDVKDLDNSCNGFRGLLDWYAERI